MTEPTLKRRRRNARSWHRWLGLVAAIPLLWLSISGLLLNHAAFLGLNESEVSTGWILKKYNQVPEGDPRGIQVGDRKVSQWGKLLFLDHEDLQLNGNLVGGVAVKNRLVIATDERVAIVNGSGEMELDLDELSLPPLPVEGVGVEGQQLVLRSAGETYRFSDDFLSFEEAEILLSTTSLSLLEDGARDELESAIRTRNAMPLSRVILDAHSGKLFGLPGTLLTDLAAISVIVLTILGLRLFPKRKP